MDKKTEELTRKNNPTNLIVMIMVATLTGTLGFIIAKEIDKGKISELTGRSRYQTEEIDRMKNRIEKKQSQYLEERGRADKLSYELDTMRMKWGEVDSQCEMIIRQNGYRLIKGIGISYSDRIVSGVFPNMPAQRAGMEKGDEILQINEVSVEDDIKIQDMITGSSPDPISITVKKKDGTKKTLSIERIDLIIPD